MPLTSVCCVKVQYKNVLLRAGKNVYTIKLYLPSVHLLSSANSQIGSTSEFWSKGKAVVRYKLQSLLKLPALMAAEG